MVRMPRRSLLLLLQPNVKRGMNAKYERENKVLPKPPLLLKLPEEQIGAQIRKNTPGSSTRQSLVLRQTQRRLEGQRMKLGGALLTRPTPLEKPLRKISPPQRNAPSSLKEESGGKLQRKPKPVRRQSRCTECFLGIYA